MSPPQGMPRPRVAANIRFELDRQHLTVRELAERLSVHTGRPVLEREIRRWLSGLYAPRWPMLCALAAVLERDDPNSLYAPVPVEVAR